MSKNTASGNSRRLSLAVIVCGKSELIVSWGLVAGVCTYTQTRQV